MTPKNPKTLTDSQAARAQRARRLQDVIARVKEGQAPSSGNSESPREFIDRKMRESAKAPRKRK